MQHLQSSAANQSRNPPMSSLGYSHSPRFLNYIGLFLILSLLFSAIVIAANNTTSPKQRPASMQVTPNASTATGQGVRSDQAQSIKSIGTDPPPAPDMTTVSINGQSVPIPSQGSTSQTVTSGGTETHIDITHSSSSTGGPSEAYSSNSLNISVNSSSDSTDNSSSQ